MILTVYAGDVGGSGAVQTVAEAGSEAGSDYLARLLELVPPSRDHLTFDAVPAVADASYLLTVNGNSHRLFPFRESTDAVQEAESLSEPQPMSNHCKATATEFGWDNFDKDDEDNVISAEPRDLAWGAWKYHWRYGQCSVPEGNGNGVIVLEDDFNDGSLDTSKWSYQGASESSNCGYTSSPRALYFSGTSGRSVTTKSLNVWQGGELSFSFRHGTGTGGGPCDKPEADHNDDFALEYSTDGGSSWTRIKTFFAGSHGSWTTSNERIPADAQTTSTKFRWVVLNFYASTQRDHWALDDVEILAYPSGTGGVVFEDQFNDGSLDTSKWSYQGASETDDCGSYSSPRALYFSGTSGRSVTTKSLDVRNGGEVEFRFRHGTGTGGGPCDKPESSHDDDFALEYSANGGSWRRMVTMYAGDHGSWSGYLLTIPDAAKSADTRFRWVVLNYYPDTQRDHWALDDVTVTANAWQSSQMGETKPGFGFGFRGQNKVWIDHPYLMGFGGAMDGDTQTQCQYTQSNHYQTCWGHYATIQAAHLMYYTPSGSGIEPQTPTVHGYADIESECSKAFPFIVKAALTLAAFEFAWLGIPGMFVPDEYCDETLNWEETDYHGLPGNGVRFTGMKSLDDEVLPGGHFRTVYTETGRFPVQLRGAVDYEVWMKACHDCTDKSEHGMHYYTVDPVFEVVPPS